MNRNGCPECVGIRTSSQPFRSMSKMKKFKPKDANKHYESLQMYADTRTKEISEMSGPFVKITDRYGRLISRVTLILSGIKPENTQDKVLRDLMADIFDCLYESRFLVMASKLNVAFPVARRAYESLSLMSLCGIDKSWAEKWQKGQKIGNAKNLVNTLWGSKRNN